MCDGDKPLAIPRLVCEDVLKISLSHSKIKFSKRPWDRYRAETSSWWLVPSSDLIHYKYGKLYFSPAQTTKNKGSEIRAGFFIEKGLSKNLSSIYSSREAKHLIMDDKWAWTRVCLSDKIKEFITNILDDKESLKDIRIKIEGGYVSEPTSFNPYNKEIKWDKYLFAFDDNKKMRIIDSERKSFILKMHSIDNIENFTEAIKELSGDDWLWLSLFIYVCVPVIEVSKCSDIINSKYHNFFKNAISLSSGLGDIFSSVNEK